MSIIALLLLSALAGFSFIPPAEYVPPPRRQSNMSEFNLDEKVGWYRASDGGDWLITWGAVSGLTLTCFDPLVRKYLKPLTEDRFAWQGNGAQSDITFGRDENGKVMDMKWRDEEGLERSAVRDSAFGYRQTNARFSNRDVELAGTLLMPFGQGLHPAVVFIHGSGVSHRDNLWYLHQADYLAKHGIAVLFSDKRGCGQSGGEWHVASFVDFAEDALAGVALLGELQSVDRARIGLVGFSQGGWIAPLAASKSADVRFVVNVAGSTTTPSEQLRHEVTADMRRMGIVRPLAVSMAPLYARRAQKRRPLWWQKNGEFDPMDYWNRLSIPALFFYGKKDEDDNVPVSESVARLRAAEAGNPSTNFVIQLYEDSGHALEDPNAATRLARRDYLDKLAHFIHSL